MDLLEAAQGHGAFRPAIAAHLGPVSGAGGDWVVDPEDGAGAAWVEVANTGRSVPAQGWKLHVSATAGSAMAVLARSLPVLAGEEATFKVAASPWHLERLNQGFGGAGQVGKFLTVYPTDDAQAVRLARALDDATDGLSGPRIPSDRQLRPGSLVHYRYGAFEGRWVQTTLGEVVPAIEGPSGSLVPDVRWAMYHQPEWVTDPFVLAGVATPPLPVNLIVAGRYLTVAVLNNSARTAVRLALDIETGERCVLKHARCAAAVDGHDESAVRIRREGEFLARFADDPHFPRFHGYVEDGADLFLKIEHCDGPTLEQHVTGQAVLGRHLPVDRTVAWARELALVLDGIHRAGFVYGDLKPSNVIVAPSGPLKLLDFETVASCEAPADTDDGVIGTLGFLSPQQVEGGFRTTSDDIYAFGALLWFLLTAAHPSDAPDPLDLLDRPLRLVNPAVPPALESLVGRCLQGEATERPASMAGIEVALSRMGRQPEPSRSERSPERAAVPVWAAQAAERLVSRLCSVAASQWPPRPGDPPRRDLHDGAAGVVLALAEACSLPGTEVEGPLAASALALAASAPLPGGPLPGLYVGEAGIGAALLRAGVVLDDDALIAAAAQKGRLVAAMPHVSPDLYNGTAGRARFHLALADVTGDTEHGDAAVVAGDHLLAIAERSPTGHGVRWPIPAGYGPASGKAYLGYAHGAAGVADVLLDLFEATGEERFAAAARRTATGAASCALPALDDGSGRDWADRDGGGRAGPFWCHGAAGIGRFLLRAAGLADAPDVQDVALAAARAAGLGARWAGPGQCHGLAGNAELLLDVFTATGDPAWLDEAYALVRLLQPFVDSLDDAGRLPESFLHGRAGILACLLRVLAPGRRPHVLDRRALGRAAGSGPTDVVIPRANTLG